MQNRKIAMFAGKQKHRAQIGGVPVMNATVNEDDGIIRISLVDWPAVESDFLTFHKDAKKEAPAAKDSYKIVDEEKRIIYGVVMRADFPIYRYDDQNGEYFIVFTKEVIRQLAEKYLAEGRQNNVNVMHLAGSDVEGVDMVQFFIKDVAAGVNPTGFEVIEDGSLFAEFHVTNEDIWQACKNGEYRGFSVEIYNGMIPAPDGDFAAQLNALITNSKTDMKKKVSTLKAAAAKIAQQFKSISTDKGVLEWDGQEDAVVGTKVYTPGEGEEERKPAADGDYTDPETGTVFTVADGAVVKITTRASDDETPEERIAALEAEVEGLEDVIEQLINVVNGMGADIKAFKKAPAGQSAHNRFTGKDGKDGKDTKQPVTGYARLRQLMGKGENA